MKYVDIASRFGDVTLRLTPVPHPWDDARVAYDVQLTGVILDASAVYVEADDAPRTLIEFCRELADDHKGFDDVRTWESAGGALKIRADHDQINATRLYVTLTGGPVPHWSASAELHVDPFRFDRVAINLELFRDELLAGEVEDPTAEPPRIDPRERERGPRKKIGTPNPKAASG
jgi:uncharacterized protein DUF6228